MAPLALVDQLPLDVAHSGIGLGALGVLPRINPATCRSSMARSLYFLVTVLVIWCWAFPRAGPGCVGGICRFSAGLPTNHRDPFCRRAWARCHLPQLPLHLVGGFGIPVGLPVGVGAQGVDARVDTPSLGVPFRLGLRWLPELQADVPPARSPS